MTSWFLNPWTMIIGALLILAPIIIHLINRLRVKRVRWGAMEFLLKAQKKLKRKVILQQLLLLASRCFLIGLLGLLFGRFVGCGSLGGKDSRATMHFVFLDDSPSMADTFRGENGKQTDSFEEAKRVITEKIVPAAAQASSPQSFEIIRLSDLATPRNFGRANSQVIEEMKTFLASQKPSTIRTAWSKVIQFAKDKVTSTSAGNKDSGFVMHIVSDFRAADWALEGPSLTDLSKSMKESGVKIYFVDVAHPYRKSDQKSLPFHDNVSIVDFRPTKPLVARGEPVEFILKVQNFGNVEQKGLQISIRVNGDENKGGRRVQIPTLPGNQERTVKAEVLLDRLGTNDKPLDRFSLITAVIETPENGGIAVDNVRHAVVEVREKLTFLVVEGRPNLREKREGDGFYLRTIFGSVLGGYSWDYKTARDLETIDLKKYSCVFLLNVPTVSEPASKNLENYIREGGGVGVFLGPDVRPGDYNKNLYADGNSWFPVPLPEKPSESLSEDQQLMKRFNLQKKIMLRDRSLKLHPAVSGLYTDERGLPSKDDDELEKYFRFISVNQYWPIRRLGKWREDKNIIELFCMPNEQSTGNYEGAVQQIENKLPIEDVKFERQKNVLTKFKDLLRKARSSSEPLFKLATLLDQFLADQRSEGDNDEALLREFWAMPETADLKNEVTKLRDSTKYGDPFYIARQYGHGRVSLITTTAGEQWNDWASSPPGNVSFGPMMKELATYLSGGTAEDNRSVGQSYEISVDDKKYQQSVKRAFLTHDPEKGNKPGAEAAPLVDLGSQTMDINGSAKTFDLKWNDTAKPGAYLVSLGQNRPVGSPEGVEAPEYRAQSFNIDTASESDLKRSPTDDLLQYAPGASVHSAIDTDWLEGLKNKSKDLSEYGLLFLLLLLLLIFEQALSVRMSYHNAANEMASVSPSAAAAMQTRTQAPVENA
jgi:hypothetical protein